MSAQTPRFKTTDFSEAKVEEWNPGHISFGRGFKCNRSEFLSHWKRRIPRDVDGQMGRCWDIIEDSKLVGYITLLADRLQVLDTERHPKRILKKKEKIEYDSFPAIKIGLLAADRRAHRAGKRLMLWAIEYVATEIAPKLGARFITVDAAYDRDAVPEPYDISGYYANLGFEFAIIDEELPPPQERPFRTMYFDLKNAVRD